MSATPSPAELAAQEHAEYVETFDAAFAAVTGHSVTVIAAPTQDHVPDFGMAAWSGNDEIRVAGNTWREALAALTEAAQARWGEKK